AYSPKTTISALAGDHVNNMNKPRYLPLISAFLMTAASQAAAQMNAPAGQVNTAASPFNSPFNTIASPFNTATDPSNAGQVNMPSGPFKTAKPGEAVERHLSSDQKFREWSIDANAADDIKRIKVCRVEDVCKMRFKEGQTPRMRVRNLVVPLRYEEENIPVFEGFNRPVRHAIHSMRG